MRILYIYYNDINSKEANINQTLNMLQAFATKSEITFISNYINKNRFKEKIDFFKIKKNFKKINTFSLFFNKPLILEHLSRFNYSLQSLIISKFKKVDLIYTRDFSFILFLSYVPNFLKPKCKIVFENHTIYHLTSKKVSFEQEKKALKEANLYFPISNGIKKDLEKIFRINPNKISIAEDGVNLNNFKRNEKYINYINTKFNISQSHTKVIYTGSFLDWKGVDVLLKSTKYLEKEQISIIIVGGTLSEVEKLRKKNIKNLYIESQVSQKEVNRLLSSADIAIIPNKNIKIGIRYTSPLKLFEYLALGLPIICSNLESMKEILSEKNALFFKSEDAKDLAKSIKKLSQNKKLQEKFRTNNMKIAKKFSWNSRCSKIIKKIRNDNTI